MSNKVDFVTSNGVVLTDSHPRRYMPTGTSYVLVLETVFKVPCTSSKIYNSCFIKGTMRK
jgi:hypothetical protein